MPQLEQAILEQEHALRRLTGDPPGPVPRGTLAALQAPAVPGSLPSALLRQRPDLYQAELQLAASDRFSTASATAFCRGCNSRQACRLYVDALDYDPVQVWSLGASVLAPLFDGERLEAGVAVATAERNQAAYAYRRRRSMLSARWRTRYPGWTASPVRAAVLKRAAKCWHARWRSPRTAITAVIPLIWRRWMRSAICSIPTGRVQLQGRS